MFEILNNLPPDSGLGDSLYLTADKINHNFGLISSYYSTTQQNQIIFDNIYQMIDSVSNNLSNYVEIPTYVSDISLINQSIININSTIDTMSHYIPSLDDVLGIGSNTYDKNILMYNTSGSGLLSLSAGQVNINADGNDYTANLQGGQLTIGRYSTNQNSFYKNDGIRFQYGAAYSNIKPNPFQDTSIEPTFLLPAKNLTGLYTLATMDSVLTSTPSLQQVTNVGGSTTNSMAITQGIYATGGRTLLLNSDSIYLISQNQGTMFIDYKQIMFPSSNNIAQPTKFGSTGSAGASFLLPGDKSSYSTPFILATKDDVFIPFNGNTNTLNISKGLPADGVTFSTATFYVRGLTSSNGSVTISSTGSNTSTNWAWDLKANLLDTTIYLDTYQGTRVTPLSNYNGYSVIGNSNSNLGVNVVNSNTGNGAIANISVSGTSSSSVSGGGLSYFSSGYYVPSMRDILSLYSFSELVLFSTNGKSIDFKTGNTWGDETSKFKISNTGLIYIGVTPSTDNSATDLLLRKSDGSLVTTDKSQFLTTISASSLYQSISNAITFNQVQRLAFLKI